MNFLYNVINNSFLSPLQILRKNLLTKEVDVMQREAGFWIRCGAALLDGIIIGIPLIILTFLLSGGEIRAYYTDAISTMYALLVPVVWNGYTVGKKICGIKIRKVDDFLPPTIWTMIKRNIICGLVYGLTFGIAIIVSAFMVGLRKDKRSLHDLIAGTEVAYDW
jgi:uncharacterized RDD family membrane protein YckC